MTILDFKGNRFLITSQSDPDLFWPVNPVSMQWIQTISPNQLIPMEWRKGFRDAVRGGIGFVCPPWGSGPGTEEDGGGWRWVETMLPPPVRRVFKPTGYFGLAVSAWRESLRPNPRPISWLKVSPPGPRPPIVNFWIVDFRQIDEQILGLIFYGFDLEAWFRLQSQA